MNYTMIHVFVMNCLVIMNKRHLNISRLNSNNRLVITIVAKPNTLLLLQPRLVYFATSIATKKGYSMIGK